IAQLLRQRQKESYVVVNKTDGLDIDIAIGEFYALGLGDVYAIAASHGRGVTVLIQHVFSHLLDKSIADDSQGIIEQHSELPIESNLPQIVESEADMAAQPVKIAIVGRPNVGKSTLTNRILGEERVVVYDMPGTTRDSIYI